MSDYVGYCRCCGQQIILDREYDSEEETSWEATRMCSCPQSGETYLAYRRRQNQIDTTRANIRELFVDTLGDTIAAIPQDVSDATVAILEAAVIPIVDGILNKVTVDISGGVKAQICRRRHADVTVSRFDAVKRQLES
jgi:hypothetical protein